MKLAEKLTSLGDHVFAGCSSLESVSVPDSLVSVSQSAFDGCDKLGFEEDNATYIGNSVWLRLTTFDVILVEQKIE